MDKHSLTNISGLYSFIHLFFFIFFYFIYFFFGGGGAGVNKSPRFSPVFVAMSVNKPYPTNVSLHMICWPAISLNTIIRLKAEALPCVHE